jgi:hypothetical protein
MRVTSRAAQRIDKRSTLNRAILPSCLFRCPAPQVQAARSPRSALSLGH